jgi:TonB family protein
METVDPTPGFEVRLLTEWDQPGDAARRRRAAVISLAVHVVGTAVVVLLPAAIWAPAFRPVPERITQLIGPLTQLTQKSPGVGQRRLEYRASPGGQPVPVPVAPAVPVPVPVRRFEAQTGGSRPVPAVPEPPPVALPRTEIAQMPGGVLPAPRIEAPPAPVAPPRVPVQPPATREAVRPGTGANDAGMAIEQPGLKSDPMGVDFTSYLNQVIISVKQHWMTVWPENARQGAKGRVGVLFSIARNGGVSTARFAFQSGARGLDTAAMAAISMSNPFPSLPGAFKGDHIVVQLNFAYNMPRQ